MSAYWKKAGGGYAFLSHSHLDMEKVRAIRNQLEENGFDPLCFYLRCLTDDDEIEGLIKRELDAREWFIFLDSANARKSVWVQKEREYIRSLKGKKILTVDLDSYEGGEVPAEMIMNSMRVFLSFSHRDRAVADAVTDCLIRHDLQVLRDDEVGPGSYAEQIMGRLKEAARHGCVAVIVTENSMNSEIVKNEIFLAFEMRARMLVIEAGDTHFTDDPVFAYYLSHVQTVRIGAHPDENDLERVSEVVSDILLHN